MKDEISTFEQQEKELIYYRRYHQRPISVLLHIISMFLFGVAFATRLTYEPQNHWTNGDSIISSTTIIGTIFLMASVFIPKKKFN
jgi:hypothetical protein